MKYYWRIFSAIALSSMIVCNGAILFIYFSLKSAATNEYIKNYSLHAQMLGTTLQSLEDLTDKIMSNAAYFIQENDRRDGLLDNRKLFQLRDKLSVSELYVIDKHGKYIRATEGPLWKQPKNFFSFCEGYKNLIYGETTIERTPIITAGTPTTPYKFTQVPNISRTHIIEVGMRLDYIGAKLKETLQKDQNIISLGLFSPNGQNLSFFSKTGQTFFIDAKISPIFSSDFFEENNDNISFYKKIKANVDRCCQCKVKGLITDDENFYYTLKLEVSKNLLKNELSLIRNIGWLLFIISFGVSLFFAHVLSRKLLTHLHIIESRIRGIMNNSSLSQQLPCNGNDEVSYLASTFNHLLQKLRLAQEEMIKVEKEKYRYELAEQVAHDIRSPLAAIQMIMGEIKNVPKEPQQLLISAVNRIRDIANNLLEKNGSDKKTTTDASGKTIALEEKYLISELIKPIIMEKRIQFRYLTDVEIEMLFDNPSGDHFVNVDPIDFGRVLSNLINNAVEALQGKGRVLLELSQVGKNVCLAIIDDGIGIPEELLPKLGMKGGSYNKKDGSGLGLYHAKCCLESWNGTFKIESEYGKGTIIRITLPKISVSDSTE